MSSPEATSLVEWAETSNPALLSPIGESTHRDGNVLDLTWASSTLLRASTSMEISLHIILDYKILLSQVRIDSLNLLFSPLRKFWLDIMNKKLFLNLLKRKLQLFHYTADLLRDLSSLSLLAKQLTNSLIEALQASIRRTLVKSPGRLY